MDLRVNNIGTAQAALVDQLRNNEVIKQAFDKYGINNQTNLVETVRETPQGVVTKDYRLPGDILEKKIFSVISQDGVESKIIVGLDFDARTGSKCFLMN